VKGTVTTALPGGPSDGGLGLPTIPAAPVHRRVAGGRYGAGVDDPERLLDGLDEAQRQAVVIDAKPLCILAGAGSGKTRVLTRRVAWRVAKGLASAPHVLVLTFTRKAAGELRSRLGALGIRDRVAAGTFHAIAYAELRRRFADAGEQPPTLLARKAGLLARLSPRTDVARLRELASEIEWAKARLVGPERYVEEAHAAGRRTSLPAAAVADVYRRYEDEKRRRRLMDFDDVLEACAEAIERDPAFAAAQRWRFRHLFVDEFQDVNPAQVRLLDAWLGDREDLCVVGDPNQAIYAWNGADPRALVELPARRPGTTVVHLDHNYRSSPQVLELAAALTAPPGRPSPRADRRSRPLRPHRPDGPLPTVTAYEDERAEAQGVASRVSLLGRTGGGFRQVAVLARTNSQLVAFEEALRRIGVPYRVASGPFLAQPVVMEALDRLRNGPAGRSARAAATDFRLEARDADAAGLDERALALDVLARLADEYADLDEGGSAEGFLQWIGTAVREDSLEGGDGVTLSTFHRAKGLEWPVVFVTGLEDGLVPIGHARGPEALAEERRLLYVACTRAERELHLSWARRRSFGSRTLPRSPSPFLDALERTIDRMAKVPTAPEAASRAAHLRRQLQTTARSLQPRQTTVHPGSPSGRSRRPGVAIEAAADPELLEALRRWRSDVARKAGVPAYVVLHDTTLAAVAAARPATPADLATISGMGPVKVARYGAELLAIVSGSAAGGGLSSTGSGRQPEGRSPAGDGDQGNASL
jgi:DNA helicase-2/ATP-dependent DNA helicase PcrA